MHWWIDDNPFANDQTFDQFEFELVISRQRLAGLHWQQFGTSLNIERSMSGAVNIGIPHFDPGLCPTAAN